MKVCQNGIPKKHGVYGAKRHVPGLNPGLKVPTPSSRWGAIGCPLSGGGGPKGGRPVVEEGRGFIMRLTAQGVACCGAKGAPPSGRNVR